MIEVLEKVDLEIPVLLDKKSDLEDSIFGDLPLGRSQPPLTPEPHPMSPDELRAEVAKIRYELAEKIAVDGLGRPLEDHEHLRLRLAMITGTPTTADIAARAVQGKQPAKDKAPGLRMSSLKRLLKENTQAFLQKVGLHTPASRAVGRARVA
jgi:hypothetical protein